MDVWGHYGDNAFEIVFALCMLAWNLMAMDAWQQMVRLKRKRKEKREWTL